MVSRTGSASAASTFVNRRFLVAGWRSSFMTRVYRQSSISLANIIDIDIHRYTEVIMAWTTAYLAALGDPDGTPPSMPQPRSFSAQTVRQALRLRRGGSS